MKKILGLDLGTNSIGWALIEVDEFNKPIKIIGMGSRIIPLNSDERDEFQKGQSISKNQNRTIARSQRKGYDRFQLRKDYLRTLLKQLGIFPTNELMNLNSLELWKLRNDAVNPEINITPEQLGRILYMLNQKRGYKSARSESNKDKKDTDYVASVKSRFLELKEKQLTIGEFFYKELSTAFKEEKYYRIKEKVYPREAYIEEFDKIMSVQVKKHSFLTEKIVNKLRNEVIFYQRNLKSQKGLVSVCDFEGFNTIYFDKTTQTNKKVFVGPKVAPKTSPLFQLCKIWELVNNISLKVKNPENSKFKWIDKILSHEEKIEIVSELSRKSLLTYEQLLKILKLKKEQVFANKQIRKGLQGNTTFADIYNIIGENKALKFEVKINNTGKFSRLIDKKTGEVVEEIPGLIIDSIIEREPLYQLWHTIYSIKDIDECKNALIKRFDFDLDIAEKLSKIDFNKQSFGNKSNKAIRKLLPYLMQGYDYSKACSFAGYNHSNSFTKSEQEAKITLDKLELLPKNTLRQPIVEKILNQLINVVNAIIDEYGKPSEIRVELARELKQSKDERNEADLQNTNNKKLNEEVGKRLLELGLPTSKRYIQKYKFIFPVRDKKIKEAHVVNQCIYCGQSFNLTEALIGDDFDVDHIVPKALLFDDSQTNKVLVHRKCNKDKLNKTAYDFIASRGEDFLKIYLERVDDWYNKGIVSYSKMQRLKVSHIEYLERKKNNKETESDKKLWETFIDRQLRETQYIARKSRELLLLICNNVTTTEGSVTAKLRELWGWDDVLMNLQLPKYRELGKTQIKEWTSNQGKNIHKKEEIINWSKRDDHRHHAVDALVIACTQQGFIQRLNTLSSSNVKDQMHSELEAFKEYNERLSLMENYLISKKPFKTKEVEHQVSQILVSFKAGKKVACIGVRKINKNGKKEVVQTNILIPRGPLHEQFVYGKIKSKARDFKTDSLIKYPLKYLFENCDLIVDPIIKLIVLKRLADYGNDSKKALASLKTLPIYTNEEKNELLTNAYCFKNEFVIKYKLSDLKKEDVKYIIDEKVRKIVQNRFEENVGREKEAFKNVLWFNESKQIPILSVRCFTGLSAVEAVKKDAFGNEIGFSIPGNNHHIAIYEDENGKYSQHLCTFWHAVERKKYKIPYIINQTTELWNTLIGRELPQNFLDKLPKDNLKLKYSLQQNEMFVLGLSKEEFDQAILKNDNVLISKHLYLVWSISDNDYWFRHHLETKNSELKKIDSAKETLRYYRLKSVGAFNEKNPIKVRLNHLGKISKVGN